MKIALLPLLALLIACSPLATKPQEVISVACAPSDQYQIERCAEAVGDVYASYQQRALEIVTDPATPPNVKDAIKAVDAELTPLVRTLVQTANAYRQLKANQAPPPQIASAEKSLRFQLQEVQPKVQSLK